MLLAQSNPTTRRYNSVRFTSLSQNTATRNLRLLKPSELFKMSFAVLLLFFFVFFFFLAEATYSFFLFNIRHSVILLDIENIQLVFVYKFKTFYLNNLYIFMKVLLSISSLHLYARESHQKQF